MSVGMPVTAQQINQMLQNDAVALREACDTIRKHQTFLSTLGSAGLQNAAPNGPGLSAADAATVLQLMGFMNNVAAVYYGTGTQAAISNFDQALSVTWGGA